MTLTSSKRMADWNNLRFSPDGHQLALDIYDGAQWDVWIYDWERDNLSRLTFDPANEGRPIWTPDGRRIVFTLTGTGPSTFIGSGPTGVVTCSA